MEMNHKGYPIKCIEDFASLFAGATPSTKINDYWENGTIPWMSSGEVHMGHVTTTEKKISQLGYNKCSTKMVPLHTVVIALAGQGKTRGTVAITEIELCTNQSLCAMVTDGTVLSDYLYHNLRNRYDEIRNMCAIADGRGGLNLKIVGGIKVIVPSIEEQKEFIAFAEQSDKSKFIGFKSQFIEMFGDLSQNTKSYPVKKLSDIADYWNGLTYKPADAVESGEGTLVLRSSNIQNGELAFDDNVFVNCTIKEKLYVQDNDILMCSRNGSAALVGKTALIKGLKEPTTFGAFMMIIRSKYYPYLKTYFELPFFRNQISTGTSTINQITGKMLNDIQLPVPDMETVSQFENFIQQSDKSKYMTNNC